MKMKIFKIKMMCNWMTGSGLCDYWNKFTDGDYIYTKNNKSIKIFGENLNSEEADYIIVVNDSGDFVVNNENLSKTIFMKMEPIFCSDFWKNIDPTLLKAKIVHGCDYTSSVDKFNNVIQCNPFEWFISKTKNELMLSDYSSEKVKGNTISSVLSGKQNDEGQRIRINFALHAQQFFDWNNYGNYNSELLPWNNFMGSIKNKEDALIPYKYSFNVENNFIVGYVGEKLLDCILCETLCFYYGCPNVSDFIDSRAFVQLDLGRESDSDFERERKWKIAIEIIKRAIYENWWEKRLHFIKIEKKKILEETNMFSKIINIL